MASEAAKFEHLIEGDEQVEAYLERTFASLGTSFSPAFVAELVIGFRARRDHYNTDRLHWHECEHCGRVNDCHKDCEVAGDYYGANAERCFFDD